MAGRYISAITLSPSIAVSGVMCASDVAPATHPNGSSKTSLSTGAFFFEDIDALLAGARTFLQTTSTTSRRISRDR